MPPETPDAEPNVQVNGYGWPIAAILPSLRTFVQQQDGTIRTVATLQISLKNRLIFIKSKQLTQMPK